MLPAERQARHGDHCEGERPEADGHHGQVRSVRQGDFIDSRQEDSQEENIGAVEHVESEVQ